MAFTTKTFRVEEVIKAMEVSARDTIHFKEVKPKDSSKVWRARYVDTTIQIDKNDKPHKAAIYARDIYIIGGPYDPADPNSRKFDDDKDDDADKKSVKIVISGNNSGSYGQFVKMFAEERKAQFAALEDAGQMHEVKDQKYNPMFTTKYGLQSTIKAMIGQPFKDPKDSTKEDFRIKLTLDFGTYPTETRIPESKRGKPKCIVKDFRTGRLNETTNQIEYDLFMVDGRPVDETNAFKVFTSGSIIEEIYITVDNTSISGFGVTTKQTVQEIVINPTERASIGDIHREDNTDLMQKIKLAQLAKQKAAEVSSNSSESSTSNLDKLEKVVDDALNVSVAAPSALDASAAAAPATAATLAPTVTDKKVADFISNF